MAQGWMDEVGALFERAYTLRISGHPPTHPERVEANRNLGLYYAQQTARLELARTLLRRSQDGLLELLKNHRGYDSQAENRIVRYRDLFTGQVTLD